MLMSHHHKARCRQPSYLQIRQDQSAYFVSAYTHPHTLQYARVPPAHLLLVGQVDVLVALRHFPLTVVYLFIFKNGRIGSSKRKGFS
jgi:hypothetical protein